MSRKFSPPVPPCLPAALDGASGQLTALGRAMAAYPISPRHARMLMEVALQEQEQLQQQQIADTAGGSGSKGGRSSSGKGGSGRLRRVLPYAVALAAVLSVDSPFVHIDAVPSGGGGGGAAAGEDETAAEAAARREKEAQRQEEKDANKKKRHAAREAHAQYRVADSDALR